MAVPLSLAGAFVVMYILGYTLNNLTLLALVIAIGFVVDDAIVVIENIIRHIDEGMSRMQATLAGAREIGFTIVSITASLIAVFIPLLFAGGITGMFMHEFAVTLVAGDRGFGAGVADAYPGAVRALPQRPSRAKPRAEAGSGCHGAGWLPCRHAARLQQARWTSPCATRCCWR